MTTDMLAARRTLAAAVKPSCSESAMDDPFTAPQVREVLQRLTRQVERLESRVRTLEAQA